VAESVLDSSVLISVISGEAIRAVEEALAHDEAIIPPLVVAELVTGATTLRDREEIGNLLQDVATYPTALGHWIEVGFLRQALRRSGLSITLPDAHIAQCALERDATLITRDNVFAKIARHTKLRVINA
jgi:predicted nucleic acid-binding protein